MMNWYHEAGKESDVVFSTAVILYRTLADMPFVHRLDETGKETLCRRVAETAGELGFMHIPSDGAGSAGQAGQGQGVFGGAGKPADVAGGTEDEKKRGTATPPFLTTPAVGGALDPLPRAAGALDFLLSPAGSAGISLCAEEHLTLISRWPGLALTEAMDEARTLDDTLDRALTFAFSEKFGYFNARAEHLGPGLAVEVVLFLPALSVSGSLAGLSAALSGFGVRFGPLAGDLCLFSSSAPLGKSEEELLTKLRFLLSGIMSRERELRASLYTEDADRYVDRVYRALGLFKHACFLDREEFLAAYSDLRLGVSLGMVDSPDLAALTALFFEALPPAPGEVGERAKNAMRARIVKKALTAAL